MWQSSNEGYTWKQLFPKERFLAFYHHKYTPDRAFLITDTDTVYYTTDTGRTWNTVKAPTPPNTFGAQVLRFHPTSDNLIWTGNKDCAGAGGGCHAEAQYSRDNGRKWSLVDNYVRNCAWTRDAELEADPNEIICESYRDKKGSQRFFQSENPLELVVGSNFYANKKKLFDSVVGFAKFSEFLVVAEVSGLVVFWVRFNSHTYPCSCCRKAIRLISKFHWTGIRLRQESSRRVCTRRPMHATLLPAP